MQRRYTLTFLFGFLLTALCQAQSFRFAQLTDLHLSQVRPESTEDLQQSIDAINALKDVDFVLVTGDVSDTGDLISLEHAKSLLARLNKPYHIVMGNHETKWSASGCTVWSQVFGYEREAFTHKGVHFLSFNTGPLMRMAYGHVVTQDLLWLKKELDALPKDEPVIIVTHYPLLDGDVDNWYQATDLLRHYNVRLCIGGHYHRTSLFSYDGIPGLLMRSCLRDENGHPGFGLYQVTQGSIHALEYNVGGETRPVASFAMQGNIMDPQGNILDANGHCTHYPDTTCNAEYPHVQRLWLRQGLASIYASPAYGEGRVFVGDDAGFLSAINAKNGKLIWKEPTGARIVGTPATSQGMVVVPSADGQIYAFQAKHGKLRWTVKADAPVLGAIRIMGDTVFVGASDHCLYALDLHSGKTLWKYSDVEGYIETLPLVKNNMVVFGAWDRTLYALHQTDGSIRWQWQVPRPGIMYSPAAVWPVMAQGKVFVADPERALTALDAQSGKMLWRTYQSQVRESVGISEDGLRLYAKTMNDSVVCYSTTADVPQQLWATNVGFGYEHAPSMLIERDGIVYGGTRGGIMYALEGKSGRLLWKHRVGSSLINTVVPIEKGQLLFTSSDGTIGVLKASR